MKYKLLAILILFFISNILRAQRDTCKIGIYVTSLYDFKIKEKSFTTIFWMWRVYKNNELDFRNTTEVVNSKSTTIDLFKNDDRAPYRWVTQRVKSEISADWKIKNFPFDKQELLIEIEDGDNDTSTVLFIADKVNSKLGLVHTPNDWIINSFETKDSVVVFNTSYGDPLLDESSSYSRVSFSVKMHRKGSWTLFFKICIGVFIATIITMLSLLVPIKYIPARLSMIIGGLFSSVGSKYVSENIVPSTTSYTLIDSIHNLTFTFILLTAVISIISLRFSEQNNLKISKRIDRTSFVVLVILYISFVFGMVINAVIEG